VERLGAVAKCAPPVRDNPGLWERLDEIDMVTSDHSPSSPELKEGAFADAWGGIAGCQTTLELLAGECEPDTLERLISSGAAERFGIPQKGRIEPGADADLALVDLDAEHTLRPGDLLYRHRISPWIGRRLRARVVRTLLRGSDPAPGAGRLLTPATERSPAT
ncbi:MAG TPA: amidohydrolase family protein, partial [Solirubrobacter sp.]|nr:amidohydrolase family protein [Solirubrobacter sp.]